MITADRCRASLGDLRCELITGHPGSHEVTGLNAQYAANLPASITSSMSIEEWERTYYPKTGEA